MTSELCSDWNICSLRELGEFRNGANFNRSQFGVGLPIINVKNLFQGRYASITDLDELKTDALSNPESIFVKKGDILFARSSVKVSGAGQVAMVNEHGVQPGYVQNGTRCKVLLTSLQSCRLYGSNFTKTHSLDAEYVIYSVFN